MKIAHTADIHVRGLSRHEEYRQILKFFADDCLAQKVDHIFVGGDIFHTKTSGISPEYIEFLTWWLNYMSRAAPVHLILGNHDLNLSNLSRQDAVTPIVEAMANPRVFLYKKSGVYNFAPGYNWCVFSCFDEDGWKDVKPTAGDINIATFHGPVRGCVTETGWDIDEEDITVDYFKDYDFCMLGDIHRQQFLGYRDGKPWIGYPGTPIQQNYSEELEHGYYIWEIKNSSDWSVVNRSLPNPKPFITIDWAGSLDKTLGLTEKCPQGTRFRIRSNVSITQNDVHLLTETLRASSGATEVTYKIDAQIDTKNVKENTSLLKKADIRTPESMTSLLKSYYKDLGFSEDEMNNLADVSRSYLSQATTSEDISRYSKWSLRRLEWDNMFSYGEKNVINFEKLNGIVGIFGQNRTGKSSVVGTLMYALFNSTDRGPIKNINVCNVRKDFCSARVILDHNSTPYVVERQTTKSANKKGVISASTSLNLFRMREDGEDMDDLCGEQRNDTEKTIRSLLGHPDDFLMTSLSAQGESNVFIHQGSSRRRSILSRFLDLDIFDRMHDLSSKEVTSIKSQLKNYPERNWDQIKEQLKTDMSALEDKISELSDLSLEAQTSLALLREDLSKHSSSPVTKEDVDVQQRRVEDLKKKSNDCNSQIEILKNEISNLQEKQDALQVLLDSIDVVSLKEKQETQRRLQNAITELKHLHDKEDTLLVSQKKSLKILDEVPCGDEYPACKFIKDAHENKVFILSQEKKVKKALSALEEAQKSFESINDATVVSKIEKHEKAHHLHSKISLEISKKETDVAKIISACKSCSEDLKTAEKKLSTLMDSLSKEDNEESILIREKMSEVAGIIKEYDSQKLLCASRLGKLKSDLEKLEDEKKSRDNLLSNVRTHELVSNAFSKKGIPLLVIKNQLPLINLEVSKILQGIVDFTVEVESDEDTDSLEIYINYGDSRRIIELCSGMEKMISSIALRVAMLNVSALPRPDFFVIDEGFGALDSAGVESCSRFLSSLKSHFKAVIVITHVDGIKDSADHILEITKIEKDSRMEFS